MKYGELNRDVWPWLSPNDEEWVWQDGFWHTRLRQLIKDLTPAMISDLRGEIIERKKRRRHAAAKNYASLSNDLLTALATLRVIATLQGNLRLLTRQLMVEARDRGASWDDLGWAMNRTRQSARDAYPSLRPFGAESLQFVERWLAYDVDAARRVAYELAQNPEATDEQAAQAAAFIELADTPELQERRRKAGRTETPPRKYV